jgi:uncharacterized metal-binding protein YceD (DUF177 family)
MTRDDEVPESHTPEFSRLVSAAAMSGPHMVREIEASAAECQALAERLRLAAIERLKATVRLRRMEGGRLVRVHGRLVADVIQSCVVTLEPVPAHVEEPFGALFSSDPALLAESAEVVLDPMAEDDNCPEPMVGGSIDIGELTAQHLSLALDPYPRREGANFGEQEFGGDQDADAGAVVTPNPFGVLKALKVQ